MSEAERIRTNFQLKKHEYENNSITGAKDEVDSANDNILLLLICVFLTAKAFTIKRL